MTMAPMKSQHHAANKGYMDSSRNPRLTDS